MEARFRSLGHGSGLAMASRLLVLSASLMTESAVALVLRVGDLVILAHFFEKAFLSSVASS